MLNNKKYEFPAYAGTKEKKSHGASNIYKYFILECVCSTLSYNYDANLLSF